MARKSGCRCPYCKSPDLEAGNRDFDDDYAAVKTLCLACRRQWTEIYTLSDLLDEDGQPVVDDTGEPEPCDECAGTPWPAEKHELHCSLHQDNLVADTPVITGIPITVVVEGGVIQDILDIPAGMQVVVRDYDVEGLADPDVETDADGNAYVRTVWAHGSVTGPGVGKPAAGRVVPTVVVDGDDEPADEAVTLQAADLVVRRQSIWPWTLPKWKSPQPRSVN